MQTMSFPADSVSQAQSRSATVQDRHTYFMPRLYVFLLGLLLLAWAVPPLTPLVFVGLAIHSLRGPKAVIESLALLFLLMNLNPGISPKAEEASLLRWVVLFSSFARIIWDAIINHQKFPTSTLSTIYVFTGSVLVFTFFASYAPTVSVFKLITFTVGTTTILTAFYRTRHLAEYWLSWFVTLFVFIMTVSLPLYVSPLGYLRTGKDFQGILRHPQTFGPVAAPMAALFTGLLLSRAKNSWPIVAGCVLGWGALFTAGARTAVLAAVGSCLIALIVGALFQPQWITVLRRGLTRSTAYVVLLVGLSAAVLQWDTLTRFATDFLLKGKEEMTIVESLQDARTNAVSQSMDNFKTSPIIGIGFGVDSDSTTFKIKEGFLGLPLGASVEKGFLPSAVLEETGIAGALLLLLVLVALILPVLRYGTFPLFWMLIASLMVNGGEMVFFSIGGLGLYFWLLIGLSLCHAFHRKDMLIAALEHRRKR